MREARYQLKREIARGGMSVVFEATQAVTHQPVALKVVSAEGPSDGRVNRLLREARVLGLLQHPGVVRILDAGFEPGLGTYLAMEMLEGRSLEGILATRRKLSVPEAASIGREIGKGLLSAHVRGIVHRDVKPGNIFVSWDPVQGERVKLLDFGVARVVPGVFEGAAKLTRQGDVIGTVDYMAPEQILRPEEVDGRADQYSLASILYEAMTGQLPLNRDVETLLSDAVPVHIGSLLPDMPAELAKVIHKALSKTPSDRFPSLSRFVQALDRACPPGPSPPLLALAVRVAADGRLEPTPKPEAPPGPQRRRFARAPFVTPVRMVLADGSCIDGRSEDISEGGLLAIVDRGCPDGSMVQVRFALPSSGRIATVPAVTRWVREGRGKHALGLEFTECPHGVDIGRYVGIMSRLG